MSYGTGVYDRRSRRTLFWKHFKWHPSNVGALRTTDEVRIFSSESWIADAVMYNTIPEERIHVYCLIRDSSRCIIRLLRGHDMLPIRMDDTEFRGLSK